MAAACRSAATRGGGVAPGLEGVELDRQRPLGGLGDLGVQFGQLDGGEADLVGERLAVDEGGVQRSGEQRLGGLGGGLDEIAQDRVVADLERHAAVGDQPRLQLQDHAAAVVAQRARLIEFGPDARAHEAAVAGQRRQVVAEAFGQQGAELGEVGMQAGVQRLERLGHLGGQLDQRVLGGDEEAGDRLADAEAVAQAAEVAGTAAAQRQAAERARHVAQALQRLAQLLPLRPVLAEPGDGIQPRVDGGGIEQRPRQPRGQQARAGRGHRAVDRGQQRAFAGAGGGLLDLQAGPRRRIDGHDVGLAGPARRGQARGACRPGWSPGARRSGRAPRPPRRTAPRTRRGSPRHRAASAAPRTPPARPAPGAAAGRTRRPVSAPR